MNVNAAALPLSAGLLGGLVTLVAGMISELHLAIAMPIALLAGAMIVVRPVLGLAFLLFFAMLDGVSEFLFSTLPVSSYKLVSGATVFGTLLFATSKKRALQDVWAQPMARFGFAFLACIAISAAFAIDRGTAFDSATRLISVMLLMYLVAILLRDAAQLSLAVLLIVFSMTFSSLILMVELSIGTTFFSTTRAATTAVTVHGFSRSAGGSQADPTTAAIMLIVGTVLALVMSIEAPRHRVLFFVAGVIGSAAIVFSFSRSAALCLGIVIILLAIRYRRSEFVLPGVIVSAMIGATMLPFIPESYYERFHSLLTFGQDDWTIGRRWSYQIIGLNLLTDRPIFGVGPGNFEHLFTLPEFRYLPGRTLYERPLHNMYLSVATEYGLVGFGVYLGLIISAFRSVLSVMQAPANAELRAIATAVFFAMIGYFLASVFNPNEYNKFTWILPGLAMAVVIVNRRQSEKSEQQASPEQAP